MDCSELTKNAVSRRISQALEGAAIFEAHDRDNGTVGWIANWLTFGAKVSVNGKPGSTRVIALENLAVELLRQYECTAEEMKP